MATVRGRSEVKRYIAQAPQAIVDRVLVGAARAGANVIAKEARERSISKEVAGAIKVKVELQGNIVFGKVQVKGPGAYIAPWLEYGTAAHFISVDDSQRQGMSVNRVNRAVREGSLVIGGNFVGDTVHHPGARPHPFLRVALDMKEAEAFAAAQHHINSRVKPSGISSASDAEGAE